MLAAEPERAIAGLLRDRGLQPLLALHAETALATLDIAAALATLDIAAAHAHCRRQSSTDAQFQRHFHQWFDGFRTLKFIHALRDAGWPSCSLRALQGLAPQLWPQPKTKPQSQRHNQLERQPEPRIQPLAAEGVHNIEQLLRTLRQHWGWQ